eukprot:9145290-Pyramimonas_sp.AAC.1
MLQPNAPDDSVSVSVSTSFVAVLQLELSAEYRQRNLGNTNSVVDLARVAERVQPLDATDARA